MSLPPGWARYTTDDGKEYFHNSQLSLTQWEPPVAAATTDSSLAREASEVYEYQPTASDLEPQQRSPGEEGSRLVGVAPEQLRPLQEMRPMSEIGGSSLGGKATGSKPLLADSNAPSFAPGPSAPSNNGGSGFNLGMGGSVVGGLMAAASAATSEDGAGITGIAGSALTYAQQFFNISSDDVVRRLRLALVPYPPPPPGTANEFHERPDYWGPFWIATTAVLFLAATGNFGRLLAGDLNVEFKADYGLVSVAASMVYGLLVGVPLLGRLLFSLDFQPTVCVYGYSLAPTVPVSVLCLLPLEGTRWLAVVMGFLASMYFLQAHLVLEDASLKWKMLALFGVAQSVIFIVYRVHFFNAS